MIYDYIVVLISLIILTPVVCIVSFHLVRFLRYLIDKM